MLSVIQRATQMVYAMQMSRIKHRCGSYIFKSHGVPRERDHVRLHPDGLAAVVRRQKRSVESSSHLFILILSYRVLEAASRTSRSDDPENLFSIFKTEPEMNSLLFSS